MKTYQGTIFVLGLEQKPSLFNLWRPAKRFSSKLTEVIIEADSFEEAVEKLNKRVEKYKEIDPDFFSKVELKPFVTLPL